MMYETENETKQRQLVAKIEYLIDGLRELQLRLVMGEE